MRDEKNAALARAFRSSLTKLGRRLRAEDEEEGVGATSLSVLGRLAINGPMTAGALAHAERVQPQSLTRLLKNLESRKLVTRATNESDRRQATIAISPDGRAVLETSARRRRTWLQETMVRELTPFERDVLGLAATLLDRLADAKDDP